MDIVNRISKLICESSPYGSTETGFHWWWNMEKHIYYNIKTNEVLYSSHTNFPTGSFLDEESMTTAKEQGFTLIPRM